MTEVWLLELFEKLALVAGVACVWLLIRQNIWTFPIGLLFSALTIVVLLAQQLYANVFENLYYLIMNAYGWYLWARGDTSKPNTSNDLPVRHMPGRYWLPVLAVGILATAGIGFALTQTNASLPYIDTATTVGAFVAMWMSARKYLESWILWFVVDIAYVGLYMHKGLEPFALLYLIYLGMALMGWFAWRRELQRLPSSA